jgi:hypothetical protein
VYRELIGKSYHSQEAPLQLLDRRPKTIAILFLRFNPQRRFDNANAHLFG